MISIAVRRKAAVSLAAFFSGVIFLAAPADGQSLQALDQEMAKMVSVLASGVVTIEARPPESRIPRYPSQNLSTEQPVNAIVGSGLIIDSVGHILTTLNLVEGCEEFEVDCDGRRFAARLIGVDHRHNLAVLKIDGVFRQYVKPSPIPPLEGRLVLAYGKTIGRFGYPMLGIIAGRQNDGTYLMSGALPPGLLGGGVFDLSGFLLGIIIAGDISRGDDGGYFPGGVVLAPTNIALSAADKIICCGNRPAGYLGLETSAIELVSAQGKVIREAVVVTYVYPESPAAAAGFVVGDIVTRLNRHDVTDDRELQKTISTAGADSTVVLEVLHGRQTMTLAVTLGKQPGPRDFPPAAAQYAGGGRRDSDMERRIDSVRTEILRLQKELDQMLHLIESTR
ncbi:MAG: PDZ domain-containing protein [candidate division Zixibacteria bacterium]|nr:PDZ domain-containing protein [candidate division Zixibacteria bacterium]